MSADIHYLPTERERIMIERATAHAAHESVLERAARWQVGEVDDLEVARVMRALEGGTPFRRSSNGRWTAPDARPAMSRSFSLVVSEMIRVGLVVHVRGDLLVPAKVHLGTWDDRNARWVTACREPGENMGPKRVRLHRDPVVVDCLACLDSL